MTTETYSVPLDDMSVEQLVQISQGIGHQIEQLRAQRLHLRKKIDERIKAQERDRLQAQIAQLQGQLDAIAPGEVVTVAAKRAARKK